MHGIDAWQDPDKGKKELERVSSTLHKPVSGVRMHWLYFNQQSPENLEKAGFLYDSSLGYNDTVGYRSGTLQAFKPLNAKKLLELPLHLQDTALFYPRRMNLPERKAAKLFDNLLDDANKYGGALTINWHHRSLGSERYWDRFYINCLNKLKQNSVWFAKSEDAVGWFNTRRSISFEESEFSGNNIYLKLSGNNLNHKPNIFFRVHLPKEMKDNNRESTGKQKQYTDIFWNGQSNVEFSI